MPEVLFYHLERASLEDVLPGLLEKTRERGWKALVRVGSQERLEELDNHLWTYKEESFLPHSTNTDARAAEQPVLLTTVDGNPNGANVAFFTDGAVPDDWNSDLVKACQRIVLMFDGRDPAAMESARAQWKLARGTGYDTTYWQQTDQGRWEKKA